MKKIKMLLAMSLVILLALTGCSAKSKTETPKDTSDKSKETTTDKKQESGSQDKQSYKIGLIMPDYSNSVWAEVSDYAQKYGKEQYHAEVTSVQFDNDSSKAVSQIENFVSSGYDGIIISPTDPNAIEEACKSARDAGVVVCVYGATIENQDCDYNVAEYDTGYAAGEAAAEWIGTKSELTGKDEIQVGILNYRQAPTTIGREDGFEAALKDKVANASIVVRAEALTSLEGMEAVENFFQAYPDIKVVYSIGGGGGLGANEGAKAAGKNADDFGVFCVDATRDICQTIKNGETIRATISLGGGKQHGKEMVDLIIKASNGEKVEVNNFMPISTITDNNLDEYCTEQGYELTE